MFAVFFSAIMGVEKSGYDIVGGCFTNVMLHSLINHHQKHATESHQLHKDIADACGTNITFPQGFQSVQNINGSM